MTVLSVISMVLLGGLVLLSSSAEILLNGFRQPDWDDPGTTRLGQPLPDPDPGFVLTSFAALSRAGMSHSACLLVLADVTSALLSSELRHAGRALAMGIPWTEAWGTLRTLPGLLVEEALAGIAETGASGSEALGAMSESFRHTWARQAEANAHEAGIRLLLPLTLCYLPAFMLSGVSIFGLAILRSVWGVA